MVRRDHQQAAAIIKPFDWPYPTPALPGDFAQRPIVGADLDEVTIRAAVRVTRAARDQATVGRPRRLAEKLGELERSNLLLVFTIGIRHDQRALAARVVQPVKDEAAAV